MNANILIIGASRSGKTTLSRKINQQFGYSIVCLDDIVCAFEESFPNLGIRHDGNDDEVSKNFAPFLIRYLRELSEGPNYYNGYRFVIEGTHIDFEKIMKNIDLDKYVVIGLTYNEISYDQFYQNIKKYDTEDDWTYWCTEKELKGNVQYFIQKNQYFAKMFKEYNIKNYDVSKDREKVLNKIITDLSIDK
ncbi:MAG: hypothetical protein PHN72_02280 [Bacilli bacterium]|nr:hypothetical protein [Bacilli bacterium]